MSTTALEIHRFIEVDVRSTIGTLDRIILMLSSLADPQPLSLVYLNASASLNEKLINLGPELTVICGEKHFAELSFISGITLICVNNPRLSYIRAAKKFFSPARQPACVHASAVVDIDAKIHPTASVGPGVYIGPGCSVGPNVVLHANVTLYADVEIGENVIVHAGTVIGADGFGYERTEDGSLEKFPHSGGVLIERDVEIGSNTSIDRGTLLPTVIKSGTKIDNQVHISHNVQIGRHVAVIAQSMIGGSARIGDYAWLAPASVVLNKVSIGERATVGMGAVVVKDVLAGQTVMGSPAVEADEFRATRMAIKYLIKG
jgi:UDP-3-O-[3-hydroxymyristoyl] glucosamine N-acyltransferase